ncbi:MAG: UxaA family hydrolase [Desulfobacterales bacterium]|jgi:altronate hydrolase
MDAIVLNPKDNVAVVLREIAPCESLQIGDGDVTALDRIPYGHKIARHDIPQGEHILKYGMPVGQAKSDIPRGGHVHMHNVVSVYMDNVKEHYE